VCSGPSDKIYREDFDPKRYAGDWKRLVRWIAGHTYRQAPYDPTVEGGGRHYRFNNFILVFNLLHAMCNNDTAALERMAFELLEDE